MASAWLVWLCAWSPGWLTEGTREESQSRREVWRALGLWISSGGERSLAPILYLQMKLIACSNLEIIAAYDNLEAEMSTKVFICRICPCAALCVWLLFLESYELYITCHSMSWPYWHCCGYLSLICKHCLVIFYWFDRFCCLTFFFLILIKYFK